MTKKELQVLSKVLLSKGITQAVIMEINGAMLEAVAVEKKETVKKTVLGYVREYTRQTTKHDKGVKLEITEKSLISQLTNDLKDESKVLQALKSIKGGSVVQGSFCKWYKAEATTTKKTTTKKTTKAVN